MSVYTNPKPRQTGAWIKRTMFKQSLANVYLKVAMNKSRAVMWHLLLHWKKGGCLNTSCKGQYLHNQAMFYHRAPTDKDISCQTLLHL